ncbi:MAG TPA: hypothetical protein VML55_01975 [Planctomycetaceae bacterium]|nr:hypothetical protein [Planctomycetaceae bacterium]
MRNVYVFESRRRWVPELARQFHEADVRVRGFQSVTDLTAAAVKRPADVAVLELEAAAADCLRWLANQAGAAPRTPVVVIGGPRAAGLELPVRELGAEFVFDTIGGAPLAEVCRRQWRAGPSRLLCQDQRDINDRRPTE